MPPPPDEPVPEGYVPPPDPPAEGRFKGLGLGVKG